MIETVREAIREEMWKWGVQLGKEELTDVSRAAIEALSGLVSRDELLGQARRVRNFSAPDDVFEAVPVRLIRSLDEVPVSQTIAESPHENTAKRSAATDAT